MGVYQLLEHQLTLVLCLRTQVVTATIVSKTNMGLSGILLGFS